MRQGICISVCAFSLLAISACKGGAELKTDKQKVSYLMGMNTAEGAKRSGIDIDAAAFRSGVEDALKNIPPRLTEEELRTAMQRFQTMIQEKRMQSMQKDPNFMKVANTNKKEGVEFLNANKKKAGVKVTASGLQYKVLKKGSGKKPTPADKVRVHYKGTFIDGKTFDSSYKTGKPAEFGVGGVIKGWTEALQLMSEGSKFKLVIPSDLAYGPMGSRGMEPNKLLIFEVELLKVL